MEGEEEAPAYVGKTVSVGKLSSSPREIPQSISVITLQQMDERNFITIEDAVSQTTGVDSEPSTDGTGAFAFFSRGYKLSVQSQGLGGGVNETGDSQFDVAIYERIEVLRGPAGLLQGTGQYGALGGVVNLVRKRPQAEFAFNSSFSAGSWQNLHADLDATGPLNSSGTLRGRAVLAGTDREFFYDNADQTDWTAYGTVEYDLGSDTTVGVSVTTQRNKHSGFSGLPATTTGGFLDVSRSTRLDPDWARMENNNDEFAASAEHRFSSDWKIGASVRRWQTEWSGIQSIVQGPVDPQVNLFNVSVSRFDPYKFRGTSADLNVSGKVRLFGREHDLLFGYNVNDDDSDTANSFAYLPGVSVSNPVIDPSVLGPAEPFSSSETEQSGFYGMTRIKLMEPLTLILGGRISDYKTKSRFGSDPWSDGAKASSEFTPYGGVVWDASRHFTLYASYSDMFVPQSDRDVTGKVLEPRVGWQAETGVKGAFLDGRVTTSFALYRLRDTNRSMIDADNVGCAPFGLCFRPSGTVESEGFELEVAGRPLPGWDLIAGYSDNDNKYLSDVNPDFVGKPFNTITPARMFKLWSNYHFAPGVGLLANWNVGVGLQSYSRTNTDVTLLSRGYVEQGGYTLVQAQIGYRFTDKIQVSLLGNNLTDREYYTQVWAAQRSNRLGEPRNFVLMARYAF